MDRDNLAEKVAIVTGASSGIGRAISIILARKGVILCMLGRSRERLASVLKEVKEFSPRSRSYSVDLSSSEDIRKLKDLIETDMGRVDILIHSAGIFHMGSIENSPIEEFDELYKINVRAPYLLSQVFLPNIRLQKGQIIFINSSVGLKAKANLASYSATKHALKAVADSLRDEVNEQGVKVITVFPGRTATPMQEAVIEKEGITDKESILSRLLQPEDVAITVLNLLSLPQTAEVTDINIRPFRKIV